MRHQPLQSQPLPFLACGAAIAAIFYWLSHADARLGSPAFVTTLAAAALVYSIGAALLFRGRAPVGIALLVCLALGSAARIPLMLRAPGALHDAHRYVWDARLQQAGVNPYVLRPDAPEAAAYHTRETRTMNNPDVPSPYPPGAQLFFRLVTAVRESVPAFQVALVAVDAALVAVLWWWSKRRGLPGAFALLYAWHPVAIFETAGGAHLDGLGTAWLLVAAAGLVAGVGWIASLAFAASISVKFLPLVLAPLFWRRVRVWHAAAAAALLTLLYLPFLEGWRIPPGSMETFVERFRFNQLAFEWVAGISSPRTAAGFAVLAGLAAAFACRWPSGDRDAGWRLAWPMAISLMLSPVIYPWYLLWLVPFATERAGLPLLVWSLAVIPCYRTWSLPPGAHWGVSAEALVLQYVAIAATLLVLAVQARAPLRLRLASSGRSPV